MVLNPAPAFVWSQELDTVLWTNAAGAALLGFRRLEDLLEADFSEPDNFVQQLQNAISKADATNSFSLRKMSGFRRIYLTGKVISLTLVGGESAVFIAFDHPDTTADADPVVNLLALFEDQPGCAAILDSSGTLIADRGGLPLTHFASSDLVELHSDVQDEDDHLVKRVVRSADGFHPAGIARLDDGNSLLLVAAETLNLPSATSIADGDANDKNDQSDTEINRFRPPSAFARRAEQQSQAEQDGEATGPRTVQLADMERIRKALAGRVGLSDETRAEDAGDFDPSDALEEVDETVTSESDAQEHVEQAVATFDDSNDDTDDRGGSSFFGGLDYWYFKDDRNARGKTPIRKRREPDVPAPEASVTEIEVNLPPQLSDTERSMQDLEDLVEEHEAQISTEVPMMKVPVDGDELAEQDIAADVSVDVADALDADFRSSSSEDEDEETEPEELGASDIESSPEQALADSTTETKDVLPTVQEEQSFTFSQASKTVRFAFAVNEDGLFTDVSPEMGAQLGQAAADLKGRNWSEISSALSIDEDRQIARALEGRDTWSGKSVLWPVQNTDMQVPIDLAALPNFSRSEGFTGFRGFGVIHPQDAILDPQARGQKLLNDDFWPAVAESTEQSVGEQPEPAQDQDAVQKSENTNRTFDDLHQQMLVRLQTSTLSSDETSSASYEKLTPDDVSDALVLGRSISGKDKETLEKIADHLLEETDIEAQRADADEGANTSPAAPAVSFDNVPGGELPYDHTVRPFKHRNDTDGPSVSNPTQRELLHSLSNPVICYRNDEIVFVNEALLELTGYDSVEELNYQGGLPSLFGENLLGDDGPMTLAGRGGDTIPVSASLRSIKWENPDLDRGSRNGSKVFMMTLLPLQDATEPDQRVISAPSVKSFSDNIVRMERPAVQSDDLGDDPKGVAGSLSGSDLEATLKLGLSVPQLHEILETATDGVVVLNETGHIHALNRSAEALFGFETNALKGRQFASLFAQDSQRSAQDYLDGLMGHGVESVLNDGRELTGFEVSGGLIPLFVTIGRLAGERQDTAGGFCAVLRDITQWKKVEADLLAARNEAETANAQKSEFLAKISHEIRTPLNAIIGFSEVMADERFGPLGSERYREYLQDINRSGSHVLDLVNDLLDISKIEAGGLELEFESVDINALLAESVSLMQPEANRERVIIRTSFSASLPQVVADRKSLRQISLNLLSNALKFTPAGGQVILSTAQMRNGDVELRIRDTGVGMSKDEVELALKPYRQLSTASGTSSKGTGLGLPLTKAMVEANRAEFAIHSEPGEGTWIVVAFPSTRVLSH